MSAHSTSQRYHHALFCNLFRHDLTSCYNRWIFTSGDETLTTKVVKAVQEIASEWLQHQPEQGLRKIYHNHVDVGDILGADILLNCIDFLSTPVTDEFVVPVQDELSSCTLVNKEWNNLTHKSRFKSLPNRRLNVDWSWIRDTPKKMAQANETRSSLTAFWLREKLTCLNLFVHQVQIIPIVLEAIHRAGHMDPSLRLRSIRIEDGDNEDELTDDRNHAGRTTLGDIDWSLPIFRHVRAISLEWPQSVRSVHRFLDQIGGEGNDEFQSFGFDIFDFVDDGGSGGGAASGLGGMSVSNLGTFCLIPHLLPPSISTFEFPRESPDYWILSALDHLPNLEVMVSNYNVYQEYAATFNDRCFEKLLRACPKLKRIDVHLDSTVNLFHIFSRLDSYICEKHAQLEVIHLAFDKDMIGEDDVFSAETVRRALVKARRYIKNVELARGAIAEWRHAVEIVVERY